MNNHIDIWYLIIKNDSNLESSAWFFLVNEGFKNLAKQCAAVSTCLAVTMLPGHWCSHLFVVHVPRETSQGWSPFDFGTPQPVKEVNIFHRLVHWGIPLFDFLFTKIGNDIIWNYVWEELCICCRRRHHRCQYCTSPLFQVLLFLLWIDPSHYWLPSYSWPL